jgi:hypothetical protein
MLVRTRWFVGRTHATEAAADEADPAAELAADETAELKEAAIPEAWLAALPVSALYCVLKPEVMTEPSDWVARRGTVVMAVLKALWTPEASEPVIDAAADAAEPVALAKADERMGRAAGTEPEAEAPGTRLGRHVLGRQGTLTSALSDAVCDGRGSLSAIARLLGAVANTVGPVALAAEAGGVTVGAHELRLGDGGHVVDTQLLQELIMASRRAESRTYSARTKALGDGGTGEGGDDGEGLHLDMVWGFGGLQKKVAKS